MAAKKAGSKAAVKPQAAKGSTVHAMSVVTEIPKGKRGGRTSKYLPDLQALQAMETGQIIQVDCKTEEAEGLTAYLRKNGIEAKSVSFEDGSKKVYASL